MTYSSGPTWSEWNATTSTYTVTSSSTTWDAWTDGTMTSPTATTTWTYWVDNSTTAGTSFSTWYYWTGAQDVVSYRGTLTEEEVVEQRDRDRQFAEEAKKLREEEKKLREEQERKRKEAEKKAEETLEEHLDEEQKKTLKKDSFILVSVKSGNKYKIRKGRTRNIERVDNEGKVIEHLCVHPRICCPDYDTMLTQKLMLEHDEEEIRKVANISRY